jgi:hypothetical protein
MEHNIITTINGIESIKQDWERIQAGDRRLTYFSTFEYCYTWFQVYHDQPQFEIFVVAVMHNNQIVGIAPLVLHRKKKWGLSYISLEFHNAGDYRDFIIDRFSGANPMNIGKEIFSVIENNDHLWDEINLTHISQHSLLTQYILKSDYNDHFNYLIENPYIDFREYESFDGYCALFLPAKVKQYTNRLKRETQFELIETDKNMLNDLGEIHIAEKYELQKLGRVNRHSFFENTDRSRFIVSLYEKSNHTFTYALIDSTKAKKIMVYNTGFIYNNVFYSLNTAFLPEYIKYGVGKVLYYSIFKSNFENRKWDVFDTLTGRYAWKFEWTNRFNLLYRLNHINKKSKRLKLLTRLKSLKSALK